MNDGPCPCSWRGQQVAAGVVSIDAIFEMKKIDVAIKAMDTSVRS